MGQPEGVTDLVLVGGGHTHVQVLKRFAMDPWANTRVTVVVDRPIAVYSGMVPGMVAGEYSKAEIEIDVRPLAMRAGARVITSAATGIDPGARRLVLTDRPSIHYDYVSFDIGSKVRALDLPGVREHAIATRPIGRFVDRIDGLVEQARGASGEFRVGIVGGGAAGVELAFTVGARLRKEGVASFSIDLLEAGGEILPRYPGRLVARVKAEAKKRGIRIATGATVVSANDDGIVLENGDLVPCAALLWAAGATAVRLFDESGLQTDDSGFLTVGPTLQSVSDARIFAVGDCAHLRDHPDVRKAGVYAVREGPYLTGNLRAIIEGGTLSRYEPQRDYLSLLNLGDGTALGSKWGVTLSGAWTWRLKDWIDRRFMRKFQVLDGTGALTAEFPEMEGMGDMVCGGCAAKVGESALSRALARMTPVADPDVVVGLDQRDDAAATRGGAGDLVVSSVDAFRGFTEDPYLVGRVAAVNAASDLWAKGVQPRFAQAFVNVPDTHAAEEEETLFQVLSGARAAFDEAGVTLVGGHTTTGTDLLVGFSIWAHTPNVEAFLGLSGLSVGDHLIVTKPLGTGVLFHADMQARAPGPIVDAGVASMIRLNADAAAVAVEVRATACTDVSGFGLAVHLGEMLRASGVSARVSLDRVPVLPGVETLLQHGMRSTAHEENARALKAIRVEDGLDAARVDVVFDPQTSGGLLFGVRADQADSALAALHERGDLRAADIGEVTDADPDGALFSIGR